MITSEDLRFFQAISTHPSLAAAARALDVTAPSISQRLQNIEKKLQVQLMHRHARATRLTDEGRLLTERAAAILADLDDLQQVMWNHKNQISGKLKVLAPLGFGNDYVAPLMAKFRQQYPEVTVELELSDTPDWSAGHTWDLMIYIGELKDSSLHKSVLAPNRRFLCASPEYIAQHGAPKCPKDLLQHACIALRENAEDVTMWRFTSVDNGKQESVRVHPSLASNEGRSVKQWAIDGHGIILRSEWDLAPQLQSGQLIRLLDQYNAPSADIVALLGTDRRNRCLRTNTFLELLQQNFKRQPWLSAI